MSTFRELNENERNAIASARAKGKLLNNHPLNVEETNAVKVSYEKMQGGFCVCVIVIQKRFSSNEFGYLIFRGASRRSYKDTPNSIKGEMLAFRRAILFSRPVELA